MGMTGAYEEGYFAARADPRRDAMQRQELARIVQRTGLEQGTVLDVGCGLGEFLDLFPAARWQRYGIEVSRHARNIASDRGISFDLPEGKAWCDLVVLRGSLQHLDRPLDMLWKTYDWVRPGGWLVALATPNAGGPVYRLFQDLPPLVPELNFVVFSGKTLRQALLNIGYERVELVYPYVSTPYASPLRDHALFALRLLGIKRPFAFWRNMMECYARR
jgi:SAM-dependent methyltransferase